MPSYTITRLNSSKRKISFNECMVTHKTWSDSLKTNARNYTRKTKACDGIAITGYIKRTQDNIKLDVTHEAISEIKRAFWFPKQVHVYCDDDALSRGYVVRKTTAVYEAHIGLGNSAVNYVRAATGGDGQWFANQGYKNGGPWDGASWRLFADTIYEATRGATQVKNHARLKAAVLHEIGHILWQMNEATDYYTFQKNKYFVTDEWNDIAKKLSYSAAANLNEFVAEFFSAFWSGERFSSDIAGLYKDIGGHFPDTFAILKEIKPGIGSLLQPSVAF